MSLDNALIGGGGGDSGGSVYSGGLVRASIRMVSVSEARQRTTTSSSSSSSNGSHLCINNCMSSNNISKNISIGNTRLDLFLATSAGTTLND